jgi:predicted DNA-binding transcriptional regulator AlpA
MKFERLLITKREARELTGLSLSSLTRAIASGALPSRLLAGRRRILLVDLQRFAGLS